MCVCMSLQVMWLVSFDNLHWIRTTINKYEFDSLFWISNYSFSVIFEILAVSIWHAVMFTYMFALYLKLDSLSHGAPSDLVVFTGQSTVGSFEMSQWKFGAKHLKLVAADSVVGRSDSIMIS
jgi:hypothetical protein